MEKFIQDASSAYWWISVIAIGLLINIASAYLKPFIESRLAGVSSSWQMRKAKRQELFIHQVQLLRSNQSLAFLYAMREQRYRVRSVGFTVLALLLLLMANTVFGYGLFWPGAVMGLLGNFLLMFALDDHFDAMKVVKLVNASVDELRDLNP